MKKMINEAHIEGVLYEHKLKARVTGPNSKHPGTEFISGDLKIATDKAMTNIVTVHYTYVTPCWGNTTKPNPNFGILKNIVNGVYHNVMEHGAETALKLNIDSSIGLNDFYTNRNSEDYELVSNKWNDGGFIHLINSINEDETKNDTFKTDMIITKVRPVDANIETEEPAKAIVKGFVFGYPNALLPVEYTAVSEAAINYFMGLEASEKNPTFTCVKGRQVSSTVVKKVVEESAFGPAEVREIVRTRKDFIITGASPEPYIWDDESTYTIADLQKGLAERETYLATVLQRQKEYDASRNQAPAAATTTTSAAPAAGGFQF